MCIFQGLCDNFNANPAGVNLVINHAVCHTLYDTAVIKEELWQKSGTACHYIAGILPNRTLSNDLSEILKEILIFSFKKCIWGCHRQSDVYFVSLSELTICIIPKFTFLGWHIFAGLGQPLRNMVITWRCLFYVDRLNCIDHTKIKM